MFSNTTHFSMQLSIFTLASLFFFFFSFRFLAHTTKKINRRTNMGTPKKGQQHVQTTVDEQGRPYVN